MSDIEKILRAGFVLSCDQTRYIYNAEHSITGETRISMSLNQLTRALLERIDEVKEKHGATSIAPLLWEIEAAEEKE